MDAALRVLSAGNVVMYRFLHNAECKFAIL